MPATSTLILLRHGQSSWNEQDLFTGWVDVDLTELGEQQASAAGTSMRKAGLSPDVVHTSLLTRAIRTAQLALEAADLLWLPIRRSWRLNERHYGDLQGKNKTETLKAYGEEQFKLWRRSYSVPPPPIEAGSEWDVSDDPRYAVLAPDARPLTECLADVVVRLLPYWYDAIVPDLAAGRVTLVAAHGNSLRALVKHLDGLSDEQVVELNIPTGNPLVYQLDSMFRPTAPARYLDEKAAAAGIAEVKNQGR